MHDLHFLLRISRSHAIARRYFVVNGFDGALTMLGIITGFYFGGAAENRVILLACFGAAVALGMSGVSSAYISEAAERRQELRALEAAMAVELGDTAHGTAARLVPVLIAVVNGAAPFLISLLIILPLWLAEFVPALPLPPLQCAIATALVIIFCLGMFLGRVSGTSWFFSGARTLLVALLTCAIIYAVTPG